MAINRRPAVGAVFAAALVAVAALVQPACGQEFKVIEPRVTGAQAKVLGGQVATILRDAQAPNAEALKQLDSFFKGYLYSSMTSTDPVALGLLSEKREQLFQRYINAAKSQAARDHLNTMTLQTMSAIVKGPYHPAVRYNAALVIGQLDAQPGAKALPAATEALLSFLESDQFNNQPVPTAIKVAALVSLPRHLRLGVEAPIGERITKAALTVANREELPEDVTAKTYGWIRRQAAAILLAQSAKGLTPPVYQAVLRIITDDKCDLDDRCSVAQMLKPEMFTGAQGLEKGDMARALGSLAREVLNVESKEAGDYIEENMLAGVAPMGGGGFEGGGRGGMFEGGGRLGGGFGGFEDGGMGMPEEAPAYEKRRLIDRTLAIAQGLTAVEAGSTDEMKARLAELRTAMVAVADGAAPDNATLEDITTSVVDLQKNADLMIADWAPPAADEEAAPADAEEMELPEDAPAEDAPAEAAG